MALASLLAFVAGILSTLSPCVLPLLPIVLGTAATEHKLGPAALAAGLSLSFVIIGVFVATIGFAMGLDAGFFRTVAALLLVAIGLVLLSRRLQERVAIMASPIAARAERRFGGGSPGRGLVGQFGVGLLLGAVWSPCVGPTLGAAAVLASQGTDLVRVALTMLAFGLGAALPLLLLGMLSRQFIIRIRGRLLSAGHTVKAALGGILVGLGLLVLTRLDKAAEAALVEASPAWLTWLTTRF
ncbi:MAG: cytochrome c biogenesis protein CcdA [Hyphomicrobiaceae bacterium]|nr:MAG: cytochrome c biogenesis protein CcdA [Hyphomicrobiaceae bacterium]